MRPFRLGVALLILAPTILVTPVAVFANGSGNFALTLYLPHASRVRPVGDPESCASAPACPGTGEWDLHCGGMGAMRDAFSRTAADGTRPVMAVGDGAAWFDADAGRWQAQIGVDLSGLRALHLGTEGDGGGWAVGERTRLAELGTDGCWSTDDARINGGVTLNSVVYEGAGGTGWAVGSRGIDGTLLRLRIVDGAPMWSDASGLVSDELPPLSDFSLSTLSPPLQDAWLVSATAGQLLRAQLGTSPDGESDIAVVARRVDVTGPAGEPASPREIGMRHDEGWVVGEVRRQGDDPLVQAWRHVGGDEWRPEFEERVGVVVDLYFDNSLWPGRWWLGLSPGGRGGVLRTTETADGSRAWDHWDPIVPEVGQAVTGAGHHAIAPLQEGRILYGWGDKAWAYDPAHWRWDEVLARRRLVDVAPHGPRAWVLAAPDEDGADRLPLWLWDGTELRPAAGLEGAGDDSQILSAIGSGGGASWAVGAHGVTFRQRGATGWWQAMPRVEGAPDLSDVAVASDASAWSIGRDASGQYGIWRFDENGHRWDRGADIDRQLSSVTALPRDRAWAVGMGVACDCTRDGCLCDEDLAYESVPGDPPIALAFHAVTAVETGVIPEVWATGDHAGASYVVSRGRDGWRDAPVRVLGTLPQGATIVDLAAGARDDIWSLATCHPYAQEDRGVTIVSHFRGLADAVGGRIEAREALVLSVPARRLAVRETGPGERTVWLAGDWSSLLSMSYGTGSRPPGVHAPPVPDLRCAAAVPQSTY